MLINWSPFRGRLKANVDGSSLSSSSGGGGIVRSNDGRVVFAFSYYYGSITNNEAKMRAIWDLLQNCELYNPCLSVVESDSMNVIRMIKG